MKKIKISILFLVALISVVYLYQTSEVKANEESDRVSEEVVLSNEIEPNAKSASLLADEYPRDENGDIPLDYKESAEVDTTKIPAYQIKDIRNDADFQAAFKDPNIVVFNIVADFAITESTGDANYVTSSAAWNPTGNRSIVIEGNNHIVDFRGRAFRTSNGAWDITLQNLTMYSRHYYGVVTTRFATTANQNLSTITYHNIKHTGSQLLRADDTPVKFSGNVSTSLVASYVSPFGGASFATQSFTTQQNLEVGNAIALAGTTLNLIAGNVGSTDIKAGGTFEVSPNANVTIDNTASTGTTTGELAEALLISGNLDMKEQSKLLVKTVRPYSAVHLASAGSFLKIARKAKLDVNALANTQNDAATRNVIRLGTSAVLSVGEEGILSVSSTYTGAGTGSVIYADNSATFTVAKKGTFSVESDGTGSKSLVRMGTNAKFQFSDAEQVDMRYIGTPNAASSLVEMSGSAGYFDVDVQRVKQWNQGNLGSEPSYDWSPMFGMRLPYSARVINNGSIQARSTSSTVRTSFMNYFNTGPTKGIPGAQRILFEYIPDVNVSFDSISNDLITDISSTTVKGVTNPDAYIRISYYPPANGKNITIENKIPSPVDRLPGEAWDNQNSPFTTKGVGGVGGVAATYSYTLPNDQHFEAGGVVAVYAFKEGKDAMIGQIVLDKTPPTGEAAEYHARLGDTAPTPGKLVKNPSDTNPATPAFKYEFAEENSAADIAALMNEQGEHDIYVYLLDGATDTAGKPAPNKTKIKSKLIVHDSSDFVEGNPITAKSSEIKAMTPKELSDLILQRSKAVASSIKDGRLVDLTDKIEISDFGGLSVASTEGIFTVTLTVKASAAGIPADISAPIQVFIQNDNTEVSKDEKYALSAYDFDVAAKDYPTTAEGILSMIRDQETGGKLRLRQLLPAPAVDMDVSEIQIDTSNLPAPKTVGATVPAGIYSVPLSYGTGDSAVVKTINVTVVKSEDQVTIDFVDEKGKPIPDITSVTIIGNIGDKVNLKENKDVQTTLDAIIAKRYVLDQAPVDEEALAIKEGGTNVKYVFKGTLSIASIPNKIDFGLNKFKDKNVRVESPNFEQPLAVWDNRSDLTNWTLTAKVTKVLTNTGDEKTKLPDAIRYNDGTDDEIILGLDDPQPIVNNHHTTAGLFDVNANVWKDNKGLKLDVKAIDIIKLGEYQGEITWEIAETP
ncbi:pectate lyase-like adhesive domain-containing protein [Enterococcus quebecensis]|uniref:MucBP domain-containing protein n=1 Tax=Enterococcus quebecensis TaxID=903983 RepID=A0A1E5GSG2_9ENTE|nr:pectate lyase-like adhesive domain-containing protein [Enterococcus quebecensis]OEG15555.1 hypothetical protein BCR23_08810 [Enterococcus quebecensis]OJG74661.1 hypothetical protein RV12_GL002416 [Enterococcus quebecensis]